MSKTATRLRTIRLWTVFACTTALVAAAANSPVDAAHHRKHPRKVTHRISAPFLQVRPAARPGGNVCPGSGRSFECKIWPPPFDDDPDRKMSGTDGG